MNLNKKSLIYFPKGEFGWNDNSFMTPTPILLSRHCERAKRAWQSKDERDFLDCRVGRCPPRNDDNEIIRIYGGMRDKDGVSRIGYVDVNAKNPSEIIKISKKPVLDIGKEGCFDDNGVILGDVIRVEDKIYMYYVGFQLVKRVKFLAFTGLAISEDGGESFKRYQHTPIMERGDGANFIRAIHCVNYKDGIFKAYFSKDKGWQYIDGKPFPAYNIWSATSKDGINFTETNLCIDTSGDEYRIGRGRIICHPEERNEVERREDLNKYKMYYSSVSTNQEVKSGYAISDDGENWVRQGLIKDKITYPAPLGYKDKTYIFYTENQSNGLGWSEL